MGVYLYGASSKKRQVKGLEVPVFALKYISKPFFGGWGQEADTFSARMVGVYNGKDSMKGSFVAYELSNEEMPVFKYYVYKSTDNTFYDSQEERVLEFAGYIKRVGKKGLAVATEEEYEDAMIVLREAENRQVLDYSPWDNALIFPANASAA